jgi:hypothetical protein
VGQREPSGRPRGVAAAIYGQILITAVVAALSEDSTLAVGYMLLSAATTVAVLWVAHVYAEVLARGIHIRRRMDRADVRSVLAEEWPMLETAVPTIIVLLLGMAGAFSRNTTVSLAVGVGVATLCVWGFLFGRAAGESWTSSLASAATTGALGLVIVALKAIVH